MALEDLVRLISPRCPKHALAILRVFYYQGKDDIVTKADLMKQLGMKQRTLEYYITKLRHWRIISTERHWGGPPHYHLSPTAFHARVDTLLVDSLQNLVDNRVWQAEQPTTTRFASAEVRR